LSSLWSLFYVFNFELVKLQLKPLNVITLIQGENDNIDRIIAIISYFYTIISSR
jgi:hypothetical protein